MGNLDYAAEIHKPSGMIDSATLTGAMVIALGSGATGVFCKNDTLWSIIEKSGFNYNNPLDFKFEKGNTKVFLPIGSSILISIILSIVFYLIKKMF